MSEPIPESIPTSQDPRSKRPTKRRALTPTTAQASQVEALFAKPDREIQFLTSDAVGRPRHLAAPPEIVANVQGSSAGAGSGEFHVYKASRRREYERLRLMDVEVRKEKENEEFESKKEELRKGDEAKTNRNKAKREKMKARKQKGKSGSGVDSGDGEGNARPGVGKGADKGAKLRKGVGVKAAPASPDDIMANELVPSSEGVGVIIDDDD